MVLVNELVDDGAGFLGLGLVVLDEELDLVAQNAAFGVDVVERELGTVPGRDAEGRDTARQRAVLADQDLFLRAFFSAGECDGTNRRHTDCGKHSESHDIDLLVISSSARSPGGSRKTAYSFAPDGGSQNILSVNGLR